MSIKILINAVDPEECRVATVKDNKLDQYHVESSLDTCEDVSSVLAVWHKKVCDALLVY